VTPANIGEMPYGMRVDSTFDGMNVEFDASIDLAEHGAFRRAWGYMLKADAAGTVHVDSVQAAVFAERIHFRYRIPRSELHVAAIELKLPDTYRIELDDWHGSEIPVTATYTLRTPQVSRGDTVFVDLKLHSAEKGALCFTTTCQHGYRLRHVDSGNSASWPSICGEALSRIAFEAGETKEIECAVPTSSLIWREFDWVSDDMLPAGAYQLTCLVIGYEGWGLSDQFEFEIVP